jgi:hypothetical protein
VLDATMAVLRRHISVGELEDVLAVMPGSDGYDGGRDAP